jgi:NAD(P)-dependent dehydrogenase (short-subunit alcohol dehydrogenase family)
MQDFRDKVAVVTGAGSGIGFAMAERFARAGMKIVLADIEAAELARADAQLRSGGAKTLAVITDVADAQSVEALASHTLAAFGAVHVVCNNAGVGNPPGPIWERTVADWQWVMGVNLWGVAHGVRVFVPILLSQGGPGHIVNTASMAGLLSSPMLGIYNATKHAVVAISETLHAELAGVGSDIKVSVLCPGFVQTRIGDSNRNRPPELTDAGYDPAPFEQFSEAIRAALATGLPPSAVAERVFEAIREEKLYILTHPEYKPALRRHMEDVLEERNPAPEEQARLFSSEPAAQPAAVAYNVG